MDPDATLAALLDAFRDEDREAAYQAIEDLSDWLARGGFMPKDPRVALAPTDAGLIIMALIALEVGYENTGNSKLFDEVRALKARLLPRLPKLPVQPTV